MHLRELFENDNNGVPTDVRPEIADTTAELELGADLAGRIKAGVVRMEKTIGSEGVPPAQVLSGLYNLSQGTPIRGIEAASVAPLSAALLRAFNDPVAVSLLKRALSRNQ